MSIAFEDIQNLLFTHSTLRVDIMAYPYLCQMDKLKKLNIRGLDEAQISDLMVQMGEKAFRGKQIFSWVWEKGAESFKEMTNLSVELREKMESTFVFNKIQEDLSQLSEDGTMKFRFKLYDGALIESVLIPVPNSDRYTVCVSSQVGCSLNCSFCATGKMKRVRNLDHGEIYDQVWLVNEKCLSVYGHPITNIVYMGMGEPLLTYKSVMKSIRLISSPKGLGMSAKRITISTAGIAKMIKKLADDESKVNLALSLHAADDQKRNMIMPINEQNNLTVLIDALKYYYTKTKNRISFEYIAFDNFNVFEEDAKNLIRLCKHFPVKINIIEYNSVEGVDMLKATEGDIDSFAKFLTNAGVTVTVRRSRGKDIDAACGQLAIK